MKGGTIHKTVFTNTWCKRQMVYSRRERRSKYNAEGMGLVGRYRRMIGGDLWKVGIKRMQSWQEVDRQYTG